MSLTKSNKFQAIVWLFQKLHCIKITYNTSFSLVIIFLRMLWIQEKNPFNNSHIQSASGQEIAVLECVMQWKLFFGLF